MPKHVLCVITDGFEEIETITPVDLLRRAEVQVLIAGLRPGPVTGRSGIRLVPDVALEEVTPEAFDLLLIPGGPGVKELRADGRVAALAKEFHDGGKKIAAICAAPLVLHDAGLLDGRRFTSHSSTWEELPDAEDERVVEDGLLITSRGAGTALDFGFALVEYLAGEAAVDEVSEAIMA
ncbi:DJ-1/PfpI family protein [Luteolibacter sp. SL250]|uniref:DJ-1 family glyoxalase III n=1 Tax=Luteolibacter sp. SL250 TaxID=2995170 RepID=UPI00226FD223|nr:DJ-1 family glyoxalase III [Luteolibacter sp. SL250]WAC17794.1 DJ-1/PfpI family protein [Luteolibacter sp. SL250]